MQLKSAFIFSGSFLFFTSIAILIGKSPAALNDIGLNIHQVSAKYGYQIQNETVITADGYILTMHRIACPRNQTSCEGSRPPVLIMHGLIGSAIDFVSLGPGRALAFQLADRGYDVWLGNQRGNTWSREHVMLDADTDSSFWNFSYHEIGFYDIPAMIDRITQTTNFSNISYIGMSQGCVAYLIMTSTKPEYNQKIRLANVIAPVTTLYKTRNIVFRVLTIFNIVFELATRILNIQELVGDKQISTQILRYLCVGPHKLGNWICTEYIIKFAIGASDQMDYDVIPGHWSNTPAGASVKQFKHFIQGSQTGNFAYFDYKDENEHFYNQSTPPLYNISKITAPLAVYYSRGDYFTNVERLYTELNTIPNVVLKYKVPYDKFNHLDFIYAKDINVLVYNRLIDLINTYNERK